MEKFKFVDLGDENTSVVLCQSNKSLVNPIAGVIQFFVLANRVEGGLSLALADCETAGDSENTVDYSHYANHLYCGENEGDIIASLRSLADELEKTLNATQS